MTLEVRLHARLYQVPISHVLSCHFVSDRLCAKVSLSEKISNAKAQRPSAAAFRLLLVRSICQLPAEKPRVRGKAIM